MRIERTSEVINPLVEQAGEAVVAACRDGFTGSVTIGVVGGQWKYFQTAKEEYAPPNKYVVRTI
jgi:hypothetical protein